LDFGISDIEIQLRKRLLYPYKWDRKQNNSFDNITNFIYQVSDFDDLFAQIKARFESNPNYNTILNYALNRWYNFWSARAVEEIFCSLDRVKPAKNIKDRLVDFQIDDITFDHKTSVFPRQYNRSLDYAKDNPPDLIEWLYNNQSQEQRKHLKNRLFIVLYSNKSEHWKLKAEISWLQELIELYVRDFDPDNLYKLSFENSNTTLSDIIWGIK
jgi:hypothetical protein